MKNLSNLQNQLYQQPQNPMQPTQQPGGSMYNQNMPPTPPPQMPMNMGIQQPNSPKKSRKGLKIVIGILVAVIVLLAAYIGIAYSQGYFPFKLFPYEPNTSDIVDAEDIFGNNNTNTTKTNANTNSNGSQNNTNNANVSNTNAQNNNSNSKSNSNSNATTNSNNTNGAVNSNTGARNTNGANNSNTTSGTNSANTNTDGTTTTVPVETGASLSEDEELTNEELDQISTFYKNSTITSLQYAYDATVEASGLSRTKLNIDGNGAVEQEEFLYPNSMNHFQYDLNANGVTAKGGVETRIVDGKAYLKTDGIETNVDAINNFINTATATTGTTIKGNWIEVNYEDIAEYYEDASMPDLSYASQAVNEYWVFYTSISAMEQAELVGEETINGVPTDHYTTTLNQDEMQAALDQASSLVYDPMMIVIMETAEYIITNTDDITVDMWIGKNNLVYRGETTIHYHDPNINSDMTLDLAVNLSNYNEPVTVQVPSPTTTASEQIAKLYELMFTLMGSYSGDPANLQAVIQLFL